MTNDIQQLLESINQSVHVSPWLKGDYWFAVLVSAGGLAFSILAFIEAKKARSAAVNAGKTVRIQTITIDLNEISQRLDRLEEDITFVEARDLLNEFTRRLRRLVAQFEGEPRFEDAVTGLRNALDQAKESLNKVRPSGAPDAQQMTPNAVYNAVESDFATINGLVADLMGLCEQYNLPHGDADGRT